jgi:thiamine-phosphate pyrophosphorylase
MMHRCYPIVDLDFDGSRQAVRLAGELGEVGCSMIEVRAKNSTGAQYYQYTRQVIDAAGEHCRVVVNDRLDVALASGAAGVHLGGKDIPVAEARRIAGDMFIIGATAREPSAALAAELDGADYLGVGAVFPTTHKDDTRLIGLKGLASVTDAVAIPVFAIAGITPENCTQPLQAGAWGVSCIGAVAGATAPADAWLAMEQAMKHSSQ